MNRRFWSFALLLLITRLASAAEPALYGVITDEDDLPVIDAKITLQGSEYRQSQTDDEGRYKFDSIKTSGEFRIQIESNFCVGFTDYNTMPTISLTKEDSVEKDFQLKRACSVVVRVVNEGGVPVNGAQLYVKAVAAERYGNSRYFSSDNLGSALIGGLDPAQKEHVIVATHDDYAYKQVTVKLTNPDEPKMLDLVLKRGVDVNGTIMCSDDKPAAGWTLYANPDDDNIDVSVAQATIAEDGSFTLSHIKPGKYDLRVMLPIGENIYTSETAANSCELPKSPLELKLKIPSPGSNNYIAGRIRNSGGKKLTQGISVSAQSEDQKRLLGYYIESGSETFKLGPLPPGSYRVSFQSPELVEQVVKNVTAPVMDLEVVVDPIE